MTRPSSLNLIFNFYKLDSTIDNKFKFTINNFIIYLLISTIFVTTNNQITYNLIQYGLESVFTQG